MYAAVEESSLQLLVMVESVNTIMLAVGLYLMYQGIEIGHPVYSILFSNLVSAFFSSLLNAWVIPFVKSYPYYILTNANSLSCLLLHSCFWCVLSVLRYMYIVNKAWLEQKFPKTGKLFIWSILAVIMLYIMSSSMMLGTVVYFGYPEKKVLSLPFEQRVICMIVYIMLCFSLTLISCTFYSLILRKRGQLGVNSVNVEFAPNEIEMQEMPVTSGNDLSSISERLESAALERFNRIEEQKKLVQRAAEIQSAMKSLKTNFVMTFAVLFTFSLSLVFSSDFLAIMFALLKGQAPLWITVINFVKIQNLLQQQYDNCKEVVEAAWNHLSQKCF